MAVITNGSLLSLTEARAELATADAILPKLDAGNTRLYRQINRPASSFTFASLLDGLYAFRQEYSGKLWIEVMLIQGMNDTEAALREMAQILDRIQPDQVQITLPVRPPARAGIKPSDENGLRRAAGILGEVAVVTVPAASQAQAAQTGDLAESVLNVITRHPMQTEELQKLFSRWSAGEVQDALADLENQHTVQAVEQEGHTFWSAAEARYPR